MLLHWQLLHAPVLMAATIVRRVARYLALMVRTVAAVDVVIATQTETLLAIAQKIKAGAVQINIICQKQQVLGRN